MRKIKQLMEESILMAIDALSNRIQIHVSEEENKIDAQSIKILAEAYNIVHRGRGGNGEGGEE